MTNEFLRWVDRFHPEIIEEYRALLKGAMTELETMFSEKPEVEKPDIKKPAEKPKKPAIKRKPKPWTNAEEYYLIREYSKKRNFTPKGQIKTRVLRRISKKLGRPNHLISGKIGYLKKKGVKIPL